MLKGILIAGLFISYPYLIYRGMESGMNWLAPVTCSGVFLYRAWRSQSFRTRIVNGLFAIALLTGAFYVQTLTAKILPVLVQLVLMAFFGHTLLKDNSPSLIERIVLLQFPDSPATLSHYCWQLTLVWTVFFAVNALVCTVLAVWGSGFWWALYNGVVIYVIMGVLVIGEYVYRRIRFADLAILHQGIPDPKASLKAMIRNGRKVYMDMKGS
jgi:uncharacterized membrane protein